MSPSIAMLHGRMPINLDRKDKDLLGKPCDYLKRNLFCMTSETDFGLLTYADWVETDLSIQDIEQLAFNALQGGYLDCGREEDQVILHHSVQSIRPLSWHTVKRCYPDYLDGYPGGQGRSSKASNWLFRIDFSYVLLGSAFNGSLSSRDIADNLQYANESMVVDLDTLQSQTLFSYGLGPEQNHLDWSDCPDDFKHSHSAGPEFLELAKALGQRILETDVLQQKVARYYAENPAMVSVIYPEVEWSLDSCYQDIASSESMDVCMDSDTALPGWVLLHIPHASTRIPDTVKAQFLLSGQELEQEAARFADLRTDELFAFRPEDAPVVCDQSRLVVDVERFIVKSDEAMEGLGLGAIYRVTSGLKPLRRALSAREESDLLEAFYHPHHEALHWATAIRLALFGRCLIVDCHSFPDKPFAYESPTGEERPDICIGTDSFHTPAPLLKTMSQAFSSAGFSMMVDQPFAGSMVPAEFYKQDSRVQSIMIEVNKRLYLEEGTLQKSVRFSQIQQVIRRAIRESLEVAAGI